MSTFTPDQAQIERWLVRPNSWYHSIASLATAGSAGRARLYLTMRDAQMDKRREDYTEEVEDVFYSDVPGYNHALARATQYAERLGMTEQVDNFILGSTFFLKYEKQFKPADILKEALGEDLHSRRLPTSFQEFYHAKQFTGSGDMSELEIRKSFAKSKGTKDAWLDFIEILNQDNCPQDIINQGVRHANHAVRFVALVCHADKLEDKDLLACATDSDWVVVDQFQTTTFMAPERQAVFERLKEQISPKQRQTILANASWGGGREVVADKPAPAAIRRLLLDADPDVVWSNLELYDCPPDIFDILAKHPSSEVREVLARKSGLPIEIVQQLLDDKEPSVALAISVSPSLTDDMLCRDLRIPTSYSALCARQTLARLEQQEVGGQLDKNDIKDGLTSPFKTVRVEVLGKVGRSKKPKR